MYELCGYVLFLLLTSTECTDIPYKSGGNQSINKVVFSKLWTPVVYHLHNKNLCGTDPVLFNGIDKNLVTYTYNKLTTDLNDNRIVILKLFLDDHLLDVSDSELDTPPTNPTEVDAVDTTDAPESPMDTDGNANANADPPLNCLGSEKNLSVVPPPTGRDNLRNQPENTDHTGHTAEAGASAGSTTQKTESLSYGQGYNTGHAAEAGPSAGPNNQKTESLSYGQGYNNNLYNAIRNLRASAMMPRHLGQHSDVLQLGSLVSENAINKEICFYRHVYDSKLNLSFSFEPRSLMCHNCEGGPHHILGDVYQPACVILADQWFPAALPAAAGHSCPAILRVEDGTLGDMVSTFTKTVGKVKIPVGSVIVVGSLSHLARVGAAAYAADLQQVLTSLEEQYGNRIRVVHGIPILAEEFTDMVAIRALLDILDWLENIDKRNTHILPETNKWFKENVLLNGGSSSRYGSLQIPYRLPAGFRSKDSAIFTLGGSSCLADSLESFSSGLLAGLLATMCKELNTIFAVNLDEDPDTAKGRDEGQAATCPSLIVAGASHASRLAHSLLSSTENVVDMSISGWKLTASSAKDMAEEIHDHLDREVGKKVVVLQLFDNSIFYGINSEGDRRSSFRAEGRHHIEGELAVIGKEEFKDLFETAAPVFRAAKNVPTIVLGPTARYVIGPCCGNPDHVSNINEEQFTSRISASVRDLGRYLRQLVWHRRWRNVTVVNTVELMGIGGSLSLDEVNLRLADMLDLWGEEDPVHPTKQAYDNLATALLVLAKGEAASHVEEKSESRGIKRPRDEYAGKRPDWTAASETAVARRGGPGGSSGSRRGGNLSEDRSRYRPDVGYRYSAGHRDKSLDSRGSGPWRGGYGPAGSSGGCSGGGSTSGRGGWGGGRGGGWGGKRW